MNHMSTVKPLVQPVAKLFGNVFDRDHIIIISHNHRLLKQLRPNRHERVI
jgi:hypothetical protein